MKNEIVTKDIPRFNGLYKARSDGSIVRVKRVIKSCYNSVQTIPERITYGSKNKATGYMETQISIDGKTYRCLVHRLIAEAFIPNPNNLPEVNHKDENKLNNSVENLEWCDRTYNNNYGNRNKIVSEKQKNDPKRSFKIAQYTMDGEFIKEWPSIGEIERQLGFHNYCIRLCVNGKYKHAYNYKWVKIN